MPKYRKLHTRIIDSFDFNEMPNDFTRVMWILLTLIVDSEGRGINNIAWIRSKIFPMRTDVTIEQIEGAFSWMIERGMVETYDVNGKSYFHLPTFKTYQTGLEREAPSNLPAPVNLLATNSRPTHEEVENYSGSLTDALTDSYALTAHADLLPIQPIEAQAIFSSVTGMVTFPAPSRDYDIERLQELYKIKRDGLAEYLRPFWQAWTRRHYNKTNTAWLDWAVSGEIPRQRPKEKASTDHAYVINVANNIDDGAMM